MRSPLRLIRDLKAAGTSIIYISHHLPEVLDLADRITVLRNGKIVATVDKASVSEAEIIKLMIAKDLSQQYPKIELEPGQEVISVESQAEPGGRARKSGFSIRAKEIVGFAGLVGSGRSELAKRIFEGGPEGRYKVNLAGIPFAPKSPKHATREWHRHDSEDRRGRGAHHKFRCGRQSRPPAAFPAFEVRLQAGKEDPAEKWADHRRSCHQGVFAKSDREHLERGNSRKYPLASGSTLTRSSGFSMSPPRASMLKQRVKSISSCNAWHPAGRVSGS